MSEPTLEEDLVAWVDGELPPARAAEVEAAVARDTALATRATLLRSARALLGTLPSPAPSPALRRQVLARIAEPTWRERLAQWLTPTRLVPAGALLAAGVAAVVVLTRAPEGRAAPDEEQLALALDYEVAEDLDLLGLDGADDLDVVSRLHDLEARP